MPTMAPMPKPLETAIQSIAQVRPMQEFSFMLRSKVPRKLMTVRVSYMNTNYT